MLGAIIGDMVGSIYEFDPIKSKERKQSEFVALFLFWIIYKLRVLFFLDLSKFLYL